MNKNTIKKIIMKWSKTLTIFFLCMSMLLGGLIVNPIEAKAAEDPTSAMHRAAQKNGWQATTFYGYSTYYINGRTCYSCYSAGVTSPLVFASWAQQPTCTANGSFVATCGNHESTYSIGALGHSYKYNTYLNGYRYLICEYCGDKINNGPIVYYIKYNGNGATNGSMSNSTHTYDTSKELTNNAYTKTGCAFSGWNTKIDGTGETYTNGQSILNLATAPTTITLYAQWKPIDCVIKVNANYKLDDATSEINELNLGVKSYGSEIKETLGDNVNYQWQAKLNVQTFAINSEEWTNIDGATNETYNVDEELLDSDLSFRCMVYNENGTMYTNEFSINSETVNDTQVYVTQASTFSVTIPKVLVIDGQTGLGDYVVSVKGNVSGTSSIEITPSEFVEMQDVANVKVPFNAIVNQNQKTFTSQEIIDGATSNGNIDGSANITAGSWKGTFNFVINFIDEVEYDSIGSKDQNDDGINNGYDKLQEEVTEYSDIRFE